MYDLDDSTTDVLFLKEDEAIYRARCSEEKPKHEYIYRLIDLFSGAGGMSLGFSKEFGHPFQSVWADDLWITPDHNWKRACEAGVGNLVFPIRAEAHALPFARGFFDIIVSVDAYQYFGTDELYLDYLSCFLRPGGSIGVVVPGLMQEMEAVPGHLLAPQSNGKVFWEDECRSFKTPDQWRRLWGHCSNVAGVQVDTLVDGWRHWLEFEKALEASGKNIFPLDAEALERDHCRYLGFVRAVAKRTDKDAMNLYDSSIGIQAGVDQ